MTRAKLDTTRIFHKVITVYVGEGLYIKWLQIAVLGHRDQVIAS